VGRRDPAKGEKDAKSARRDLRGLILF
jgi:hypothetical protein